MASASFSPEEQDYIHSSTLTAHDVLSGRGPRIQNHPGNQLFRTIVASRQYDYTNAARHRDKQVIAREIVDYVRGRRGMRYSLGSVGEDDKGAVVHAVEGMATGLRPGGRFLELVVGGNNGGRKKKSTAGSGGNGKKRSKPVSHSHEKDLEQEVIVAHPDLWRLVDDDAACEKVKQAFRNLSKGLISDPKVKSSYTGSGRSNTGKNGVKDGRTSGGRGVKKKSGTRGGRGGNRGSGPGRGTKGKRGGDAKRQSSSSADPAPYPPISTHPPEQHHHEFSSAAAAASLDFHLDDLVDDFGSIEELAESLELLESGVVGGDAAAVGVGDDSSSSYDIRHQQTQITQQMQQMPQQQQQMQQQQQQQMPVAQQQYQEVALNDVARGTVHNPLTTSIASVATATATAAMAYLDLEPNPVSYGTTASVNMGTTAVPTPLTSYPAASEPSAPATTTQSSSSSTDPTKVLHTLQQCLELVMRVKSSHAAGRTVWAVPTSNGCPPFDQDLVKVGEAMYRAFAGVDPVRTANAEVAAAISASSSKVVDSSNTLSGPDAAEDEDDTGRAKRQSLSGMSNGDSAASGYTPLRDIGFPTSLCICIGSLLDALDVNRVERFVSIEEVEDDLRLMLNQPDRYLWDPPRSLAGDGGGGEGRISFPTKLYGRDEHVGELLRIFQKVIVAGGQREFVKITGFAGTGKTSLINQLRGPLAAKGGNFVTAKFDKSGHVQPMQVIFNAFDGYFKEISGIEGCSRKTPEIPSLTCYCAVRESVRKALGSNGTVLTNLMPNLRHLIDEELSESQSVEVGGVEALNRFIFFFRLLVRAIASPSSPVLLFLDDAQWADSAALEMVSTLASDAEVNSMLFVAAYREEEIALEHPLNAELARLPLSGIRINSIGTGNVGIRDLTAFISDVLLLSPRITRSLAGLVHAKTTGNILFVVQLLRSINEEGLLRYSARTRRWEWDVAAIQARSVDDNVVGLLTRKMLNLDDRMQWMLKVASCFGSQCESSILKQLLQSGQNRKASTEASLNVAVREGLMAKVGSSLKFPHDQIEQAAYSLIPTEQRQALHLSIGRTLWGGGTAENLGDRLELVVNQLNRGAALITDPNERTRVAELCLEAGKNTMSSSAFLLASSYLLQGIVILNEDSWQSNYELSLELHSSCAEAQYATGNHSGISVSVKPIMRNGRSLQDKLRAYYTLLNSLGARGQQADAIKCGMELLLALDETFPDVPDKNDALVDFQKTQSMLQNLSIDGILSGNVIADTQKYAAVKTLFILVRHAHMVNQMLMSMMICRIVQLSIIHGVSKESSFAFATYGFLLSKYVGIDEACEYGKIALNLLERFNAKDVLARVTCVLNDFLIFKEPLQSRLPSLQNAYQVGLQMGDIEWGLTDANIYVLTAIQSGYKLAPLSTELKAVMQQMRLYKHTPSLMVALLYNRVITNLMEESNDPTDLELNGDEFASMSQELKRINIVNRAYFLRMWLGYLFGNYDVAANMAEKRLEMTKSRPFRSSSLANETFYTGLIAVMMVKKEGQSDTKWRSIALSGKGDLQKFVAHSEWNFLHKLRLLEAEIAFHFDADYDTASKMYDEAIKTAKKHSFLSETALAYERAAMFYDETGNAAKASEYYKQAYREFTDWGALQKARHIYDKIQ